MTDSGFDWDRLQMRWVLPEHMSIPAVTANAEDHTDPWRFAGDEVDAPTNVVEFGVEDTQELPIIRPALLVPAGLTATRPWRNCLASVTIIGEVNVRWPNRDKSSDGTIGDAAHAARTSDHNPWVVIVENGREVGIVRARDIDRDGIDMAWLVEHLRQLGAAGDPRLAGGGYLIYNRRITSPDFKSWREYTGTNPHTGHGHISFSTNRAGYDSTAGWGIATAAKPTPQEDELSAEAERMIAEIHGKVLGRWNSRADYKLLGETPPNPPVGDDMMGTLLNADARSYETLRMTQAVLNALPSVMDPNVLATAVIQQLGPMVSSAVREALGQEDSDKADAIVEAIGRRLVGNTQ